MVGRWKETDRMLEGFIEVSPMLKPAVYALLREGVVVYVGQSKKPLSRIEAHRSNWGRKSTPAWMPASLKGILFDQVYILPTRIEDLDRVEKAIIELYKPRYNIKLKSPTPVAIAHLFTNPQPPTPVHRRF